MRARDGELASWEKAVVMRASRPWRSAFCAESCFPSGVDGPREKAPLARDERVRLSEDIAVNTNLHPAGLGIHVSRVFATQKCCDRRLEPAHLCKRRFRTGMLLLLLMAWCGCPTL